MSDIKKLITFATAVVLNMVVELLLIKVKLKSCGLRKIMGFDVDSLTLQYKAHKEISVE